MECIEAFTVCVNYNDFLSVVLPINKKHFNKWLIVTVPEDTLTKEVCKKNDIKYIECRRIYENGDKFNKGKALNDVLHHLAKRDWLIHIDADIILPNNFREIVDGLNLNREFLYGATRKEIITKKKMPGPNLPYGYFQMFTKQSEAIKDRANIYPENYSNAGFYDVEFFNYWDSKIRMLDVELLHIPHETTINWDGRISQTLPNDLIDSYSQAGKRWGKQQPQLL